MNPNDFFQALVLAAVASGLGAQEAIDKADWVMKLLQRREKQP